MLYFNIVIWIYSLLLAFHFYNPSSYLKSNGNNFGSATRNLSCYGISVYLTPCLLYHCSRLFSLLSFVLRLTLISINDFILLSQYPYFNYSFYWHVSPDILIVQHSAPNMACLVAVVVLLKGFRLSSWKANYLSGGGG